MKNRKRVKEKRKQLKKNRLSEKHWNKERKKRVIIDMSWYETHTPKKGDT